MATQSLKELYIDELRDLFDGEQQLLQALPELKDAAAAPALRRAFHDHLEQTRVQAERLQLIFQQLGESPAGKRCAAMDGLLKEGRERLRDIQPGEVRDAALIGAAQRVEHYEMAGYGVARTYARQLGAWDQADLLQQTLEEEGEADHRLTGIAEGGINEAATRRDTPLSEDARRWARLRYVGADDLPQRDFDFTGITIRNAAGDDLGRLDGFIVEQATGRPLYYVIDSGGWFVGGRYLVPVGKGRFETATRTLQIDLGRERLQSYPEFNTNAFLSMSDDQARAYERRLLASISPESGRTARYWDAYDRLDEYAAPGWITMPGWTPPAGRDEAARSSVTRARSVPPSPVNPDRELITARESGDDDRTAESGGERVRGTADEPPPSDRRR